MSNDHTTPDSLTLAILPPVSCHWCVGPQLQFIFNLRLLLLNLFSRGWSSMWVGRRWPEAGARRAAFVGRSLLGAAPHA
jgi:formate hydrogenlyase subunit 4